MFADLFTPVDFFGAYRGFVGVELITDHAEEAMHWSGWVKSRLRRLVLSLEKLPLVETVHPLPWPMAVAACAIENPIGASSAASAALNRISFFIGVGITRGADTPPGGTQQVDLRPAAAEFVSHVQSWDRKAELCPSAKLQVRYTRRSELPIELLQGSTALPFADEQDRIAVCGCRGLASGRRV